MVAFQVVPEIFDRSVRWDADTNPPTSAEIVNCRQQSLYAELFRQDASKNFATQRTHQVDLVRPGFNGMPDGNFLLESLIAYTDQPRKPAIHGNKTKKAKSQSTLKQNSGY